VAHYLASPCEGRAGRPPMTSIARAATVSCPACGSANPVSLGRKRRGMRATCIRCRAALPPVSPICVTDVTFDEHVLASPVPVLLDVWAPWCVPCRGLTPALDEIAVALAGRVRVARLNVDQNPAVAARLCVVGIPTLVLFRQGREVDRMIGTRSKEEMLRRLAALESPAP